jgi:hypothetical protein
MLIIEGLNQAIAVKRQNLQYLLTRSNVVGVGIGYKESEGIITDQLAVIINVIQKIPKAQLAESDKVPRDLDGVKTDVVETGRFLAGQTTALGPRDRWRPTIPPGVSIGHADVTAGTFGCLVRRGGEIFILSNNHVLANVNRGNIGDSIIQPGRYDDGTPADQVATLAEYIPLDFGETGSNCNIATSVEKVLNAAAQLLGSQHRLMAYNTTPGENLVDVALARPLNAGQFIPDIYQIGRPKGVHEAALGMNVQKSGRTTGYTTGRITQVDVTTSVEYNGRMATFTDQLMANGMSTGGDSGSAVLDEQGYVVGLLFAGSTTSTLINPIQTVLNLLGVELVL